MPMSPTCRISSRLEILTTNSSLAAAPSSASLVAPSSSEPLFLPALLVVLAFDANFRSLALLLANPSSSCADEGSPLVARRGGGRTADNPPPSLSCNVAPARHGRYVGAPATFRSTLFVDRAAVAVIRPPEDLGRLEERRSVVVFVAKSSGCLKSISDFVPPIEASRRCILLNFRATAWILCGIACGTTAAGMNGPMKIN